MKKFYQLILLIVMLFSSEAGAQNDSTNVERSIVQIAGIAVSGDSLSPVPFANVIVKGNYRGTMCDYAGFFSIVAAAGDTLMFSSFGYEMNQYVIPDTLKSQQYSLIQLLDRDTVVLPTVDIKVWPTYEQFKKAFLALEVPNSDLARATKNLDKQVINEKAAALPLGAMGNQKLMLNNYRSRLYFAGQLPPNNLLNPVAWMKFIKAWKEGKLGQMGQ